MNTTVAAGIDFRKVPITMVVIALLAIPFSFIQTHAGVLDAHPNFVAVFGFVSLGLVGFLAYWFVFRHLPATIRRNPFLILFAIFAFATMLDLLIALSLLGITDVMNGYFESGEPYLKSSYGMAANLWDGTAHLAMYVGMSYYLAKGEPHRKLALFWTGSLISGCVVYMLANLIGEYAEHIEPSYLMNVPFMIVPIFYAWRVLEQDDAAVPATRAPLGALDYVVALAMLGLAFLCAFRMLVVLNPAISLTQGWAAVEPYLLNPSRYPQVQMIAYGIALAPFSVLAAMSVWRRPSRGIAIWAWVFAGFCAQGQFAELAGNLHSSGDPRYPLGSTALLANLAVALLPVLFAFYYEGRLRRAAR